MASIRVVKRKGNLQIAKKEKTESEVKGIEELRRVREQINVRNENKVPVEELLTNQTMEEKHGEIKEESTQIQGKKVMKPVSKIVVRPKLKKREKFEDTHKRVTTYVLKSNHNKLHQIKDSYGIPITETLNNALQEYFKKYSL